MSFEELILTYGYPILFLGVLVEAEGFLILGAYLAHRGYFSLPIVIGVAALSSFAVTELYFYLGHRYGAPFIAKRPSWQQRFSRVQELLNRYGAGLIVGFRGLWGLRAVIPAAVGLAEYPRLRFMALNAVGAIIWAVVVALAGNGIAHTAERVFDDLRKHERTVILVAAIVSILWGLYLLYRQPKLKKQPLSEIR